MANPVSGSTAVHRVVGTFVVSLLAGFVALQLLGAQGARLGPFLCPEIDARWLLLGVTSAFFLLPGTNLPLVPKRLLGAAVALGLVAWIVTTWSDNNRSAKPSLSAEVQWLPLEASSPPRSVLLDSLQLDSRKQIHRVTGRRRRVRLDISALLYVPRTGQYRFDLSCDDSCLVRVGEETFREQGTGSYELMLEEGVYPFSIRYQQMSGPAFLEVSWDRPGAVELLPLTHYLSRRQHSGFPEALRREHLRSAGWFLGKLIGSLIAFCLVIRLAGRLWVKPLVGISLLVGLSAVLSMLCVSRLDLPPFFIAAAVLAWVLAWLRLQRNASRFSDGTKLAVVLFSTLVLRALLTNHVDGLNGPDYWDWSWRTMDGYRLFPAMLAAATPFFLAQYLHHRRSIGSFTVPLLALMLSTLALQLTAVGIQKKPFGFERITQRVMHPITTSYYTDATSFTSLNDWLQSFPDSLMSYHTHSRNKPPGPILYYVFLQRIFGVTPRAAAAGGLLVAVLAALSIPACYTLIKLSTEGNREAAFFGASFLALCPGLLLFFPQFDQVYPILTCGLIGSWFLALRGDRLVCSVAYGALLSIVFFVSYSLLVLGFSLALYAVFFVRERPWQNGVIAVKHVFVALGTFAGLYGVFWLFTGFDPVETFRQSLANQAVLAARLGRPYPQSIFFDLTDFALGSGWISVILTFFFLWRKTVGTNADDDAETGAESGESRPMSGSRHDPSLAMSLLFLFQILTVAVSGLLRTETARVWIFLLPLLMFPIGNELAGWRFFPRLAVYFCLWFLMSSVLQNMSL